MAAETDGGVYFAAGDQDIELGRLPSVAPSNSMEQVANEEFAPPAQNSHPSSVIDDAYRRAPDDLPPVILRLPNTAFGISMGLAGHAIMWKQMEGAVLFNKETMIIYEAANVMNVACWYLSCILWAFFAVCYVYKIVTSFPLVKAEWVNSARCHFFNAPNLVFILLLLGLPSDMDVPNETIRILWALAFCYQLFMTQYMYKAWMFSERRNFSEAKPHFLMSTVGWFLLSNLGISCESPEEWGIGLPQMCLGAGIILYMQILVFIFSALHTNVNIKGSPAMFLLIAPPSAGVVSLDLFYQLVGGDAPISPLSELLLGWVLLLLLLLIRMAPKLWRRPSVLGEYWAYVFPVAYASTATIWYANALNTTATKLLAEVMVVMAAASLLLVSVRTTYHMIKCLRGKDAWRDPLFCAEGYSTRRLSV